MYASFLLRLHRSLETGPKRDAYTVDILHPNINWKSQKRLYNASESHLRAKYKRMRGL